MSSTTFQVIFSGKLDSELSNSELDVKELSAALAALGQLFETSDSCLNQGRTKHTLKVKGSFKTGSFKIDFVSAQSIAQKTKDLWDKQEIIPAEGIMGYVLGGGVSVSVGCLFALVKWLKGRMPTKIVDIGDGKYKVYRGEKYYEAEKAVIQLYQDYNVRKVTEYAMSALQEDKISSIAFTKDKGKTFQKVDVSEKSYFNAPLESKDIVNQQTFETSIHLVRLSFKEGNKWTVDDGNTQYSVVVEDEDYISKIEKNEVGFSKGDILKVKMRSVQYVTHNSQKLKKDFFIEKVLNHSKAEPNLQIYLDIDKE